MGEAVYPRYNPDGFFPFLDTERLPVALDLKNIDLLSRLRCTFDTHIDYDLLTEEDFWTGWHDCSCEKTHSSP